MRKFTALLAVALLVAPGAANAQSISKLKSRIIPEAGSQDSWSYRDPKADVTKYKSFIIEPTVLSTAPEVSWGGATEANKRKYADMFTAAMRTEIAKSYGLATKKGPDVGVIKLTLLGVTPTSPIAVASKVSPMGLALSGVKSIAGKPGTLSGSAHVAFELTDSQSGEVVAAALRRRSPDALNIMAAASTDVTVEAVAKDVARAVRVALDQANGR